MRSTMRVGLVAMLLTLAVPAAVAAHERSQNSSEVMKAPAAAVVQAPALVAYDSAMLLPAAVAPTMFVASALQVAERSVTRACAVDSIAGVDDTRDAGEAPVPQPAKPPSSTIDLRIASSQRPSLTPRFEQLRT